MNKKLGIVLLSLYSLITYAQLSEKVQSDLKKRYDYVLVTTPIENQPFVIVVKNNLYGVCDVKGKEITPPIWKAAVIDDDGIIKVFDGEILDANTKCGLFNSKGKMIIPCEYEYIDVGFGERRGIVYIVTKNGLKGMIDNDGNVRLNCEYDEIESYYANLGVVIVAKNEKRGKTKDATPYHAKYALANIKGEFLTPFAYDWIGELKEELFHCNKGGSLKDWGCYPQGGKWGYIDINGKEVIPCLYDNRAAFKDGVAQVTKNGVTSLIKHPLRGTNLNIINGSGDLAAVDANIPLTGKNNEDTFAFVIANENYAHFTGADYSINDGKVFAEYCKKTLGIPEKNVRYYEDATYGNITNAVKKLQDIADVYEGDAKIIFYYSGLGATADNNKYILGKDASMTALEHTGYSINTLLKTINALNVEYSWVVLDAPFSNLDKNGKPLATGRGVAVKSKPAHVEGKTIVTLSSSGEQTAYSSKKFGHSLFTYGLLEKLQQTKGDCSIKELNDHAIGWVKKHAMAEFDKIQTPSCTVSDAIINQCNNIKF